MVVKVKVTNVRAANGTGGCAVLVSACNDSASGFCTGQTSVCTRNKCCQSDIFTLSCEVYNIVNETYFKLS